MNHGDTIVQLLLHRELPVGDFGHWLEGALRSADEAERRSAHGLLAALALRCPGSISAEHWSALLEGLDGGGLDGEGLDGEGRDGDGPQLEVARLFEGLLAQTVYPRDVERLGHRLARLRCPHDLVLELAALVAGWQPTALTAADLLAMAGRDLEISQCGRFLAEVVERWSWRGEVGDSDWIDALGQRLGRHPRWRFTRDLLMRRRPDLGGLRESLQQRPQQQESRHRPARCLPPRILVVQNLNIGQGDEIVRCGTLVGMLLAREPEARIDLVTRRAYLYDHSRIRLHDIDDAAAIETLLEESFDGLVWLDEIHAPEMRRHAWVPGALAAKAASPMTLVLEAATHRDHLDFRRLVVDGTDLGPALRAARSTPHILEQLELLALALGLPWLREGCGTSAAPFVGIPSKAARSWLRRQRRHLRQRQQVQGDAGQRPLAVVQPFGGAAEIKGYGREHLAELATALDDLVEEGLEVILLPTAAPWGAPTRIARLLETIQPQTRLSIIVAPNTAGGLGDVEERSELDLPDRTIRLFKYLIAAADLVVAVEGWAAHLAALLDTPVRLVLWAGSYGPDWYPRGCEWADSLSPSRLARSDSNPPLTALHRAPLSRARRQLLAGAMNGLGQPSERAASLLRAALRNPDPALRTHAANAAWTQLDDPPLGDAIRAALEDPSAPVRAAAAHTLLRRPDLHRPTDPRRATLEAHRAIDDLRWSAVVTLGDAALPALAVAAAGERSFTRREARRILHTMLRRRATSDQHP